MRRLQFITILALLTLFTGCGHRPEIQELTETSVVVAFEDSLTSGTGVATEDSYPSVLSELIGCRVINAGKPGEDSSSGLRRLPLVLQTERPDLVILCHGGNDLLMRQSPEKTKANLSDMIAMIKEAGSDVILLAVPKTGLRLKPPVLYEELATLHHIPFDPETIPEILSTPSSKSDQVHPNEDGYRQIAESISALIMKSHKK
jgi:lysophospholipase L1-like esterase